VLQRSTHMLCGERDAARADITQYTTPQGTHNATLRSRQPEPSLRPANAMKARRLSLPRRRSAPLAAGALHRLGSFGDPEENGAPAGPASAPDPAEREDLPFRVELWNEARTAVEQVLAVTASGGIGYAAFYAATRELPQRYITLRHKQRIVSRWNGPGH
jgi:hypothetical protein